MTEEAFLDGGEIGGGSEMRPWMLRGVLLTALFLSNLVYLKTLQGPLIWDDDHLIVKNQAIRDLFHPTSLFTRPSSTGHRFVTNASLALDYAGWGLNPWGYHRTNLLLHSLATLLFYGLAWGLFGNDWVAFLSGLAFVLHPARAEAVIALLGRSDLLCTLFTLSAVLFHRRAQSGAGHRLPPDRVRGKLWQFGAALSCALAMGSKETGVMTVPLLMVHDLTVGPGRRHDLARGAAGERPGDGRARLLPRDWCYYALLGLLTLAYLLFRFWVPLPSLELRAGDLTYWAQYQHWRWFQAVLTSFYLVARYVGLLLLPGGLSNWHEVAPIETLWDPRFWGSAALTLGLIGVALYARKREGRISFLLAWFLLPLLPVLNLVPIPGAILAERWLYLPGSGFCLLFGILIVKGLGSLRLSRHGAFRPEGRQGAGSGQRAAEIPAPRSALPASIMGVALLALVLAFYVRQTGEKVASWQSEMALFAYSLEAYPASAYLHYNLGTAYLRNNQMEKALAEWERALQCDPHYSAAHNNLGNYHFFYRRDLSQAVASWRKAVESNPQNVEARYNLGLGLERMGRSGEAMEHLRVFVQAAPQEYSAEVARIRQRFPMLDRPMDRGRSLP